MDSSTQGANRPGLGAWRVALLGSLGNTRRIVLMLTAAMVGVGLVLANDYGPSFDETSQAIYGNQALAAYLTLTQPEGWLGNLGYYGPFYSAVTEAVTQLGGFLRFQWRPDALRHLVTFLSLPIAASSIYFIANRWTTSFVALFGAILFATQPLIFGHAFINPKDMPFLAFFTLSIALGLRMTDRVAHSGMWFRGEIGEARMTWPEVLEAVATHLRSTTRRWRMLFLVLLVLATALAAELLVFQAFLLPRLMDLVRMAHAQTAWGPINQLFALIAEQSLNLPVEAYEAKATGIYAAMIRPLAILGFAPAFLLIVALIRPFLRMIRPSGLLGATVVAGAGMGLATAIRVVGPFAGLLITGLAVYRHRKGVTVPLLMYWATAAMVTYLAWPYLWGAPIFRFWESFDVMRNFGWAFPVLFRGIVYEGNSLPRYYLPYIYGVQVTIPVLALAAVGAVVAIRQRKLSSHHSAEQAVVAIWLLVPLAFAMIGAPAFYDNGRQYLFLLPPVFLFASLALGAVFGRIRLAALRLAVAALILLPGIVGIVRLHPYEYVYYNEFVGGVRGAYRQFELNYWATSLKAALETVNQLAARNSTVYIDGPWENVWEFAREDLNVYDPPENAFDPTKAHVMVIPTRANADLSFPPVGKLVSEVSVDGAVLAYILERSVVE